MGSAVLWQYCESAVYSHMQKFEPEQLHGKGQNIYVQSGFLQRVFVAKSTSTQPGWRRLWQLLWINRMDEWEESCDFSGHSLHVKNHWSDLI